MVRPTSVTIYEKWEDLAAIRVQWDELLAASRVNEIFLTFDFLECWLANSPRKCRPRVIVAFDGDSVVGIAPLMITQRRVMRVNITSLEFIGTPFIDYADFIYRDESVLRLLWQHTLRLGEGVDAIFLAEIPSTSPSVAYLSAQPGMRKLSGEECLDVPVPASGAAAGVKEVLHKPDFARHLKRHMRRLEELGRLTVDHYRSGSAIAAHLDILFEQHTRRWNATESPSQFNDPQVCELYRRLSQKLSLSGQVMLSILKLGEIPLACHWGFLYGRTFAVHTTSINVEYQQHSCGTVIILHVLRELGSLDARIRRLDFCRGTEHYKTYFGTVHCTNYMFAYSRTLKARALMKLFLKGAAFARQHSWAMTVARRLGSIIYQE